MTKPIPSVGTAPMPMVLWKTRVSGALADITKELLALTEVVQAMAERCEALEQRVVAMEQNQDGSPNP
jgi:hypothetical protein